LLHRRNRNSQAGSKKNILAHYDLGNELYSRFLDPEMMYSSAIYPNQKERLAYAQNNKNSNNCQPLELTADDHLLEIGTGWAA
jgi:cyclopropane-fatty-acyl-phospholipid synthase